MPSLHLSGNGRPRVLPSLQGSSKGIKVVGNGNRLRPSTLRNNNNNQRTGQRQTLGNGNREVVDFSVDKKVLDQHSTPVHKNNGKGVEHSGTGTLDIMDERSPVEQDDNDNDNDNESETNQTASFKNDDFAQVQELLDKAYAELELRQLSSTNKHGQHMKHIVLQRPKRQKGDEYNARVKTIATSNNGTTNNNNYNNNNSIVNIATSKNNTFHLSITAPRLTPQYLIWIGKAIDRLWNISEIRKIHEDRGKYQQFSFPENMDYYFDKILEIFSPQYTPDDEDMLKVKIRTTGQITQHFPIERRKDMFWRFMIAWISFFDNATALLYVAALNHYCTVCFEDETLNAMIESIILFNELVNNKWFKTTEVILFLNKDDLFRERLLQGVPLSVCFNHSNVNENFDWTGEIWNGYNYNDPIPNNLISQETGKPLTDSQWFIVCYKQAITFIQRQYAKCCGKNKTASTVSQERLYTHVTNATSKDNVQKVFWDVQNIVIASNLKQGGLII
ncbi:hypothetical protein RFI_09420 [Reticulomyxa filosa]|uniref:Uncharacterized protein n=1 Tax=Reticulomyxa filosa TaxID=46433 RepID=X6NQS7_RETFI|nr:hypothetical protein RFI_09420 [Reticulomyxa filosa]|eukprot:ETO27712.1 hypothetical protein RFI_09420 [Reticulomyxa filosa]